MRVDHRNMFVVERSHSSSSVYRRRLLAGKMIATVGKIADVEMVRDLVMTVGEADGWSAWVGYSDESSQEDRTRYFHALMLHRAGVFDICGKHKDKFSLTPKGEAFLSEIFKHEYWESLLCFMEFRGDFTVDDMVATSVGH